MHPTPQVILTASRIEMSDFNVNPFIAFSGGFPTGLFPLPVARKLLYPIKDPDSIEAKLAPYGLRKIEAILAEELGEENVKAVYPHKLKEAIGPETKVIGISTMDPLGLGFVSRTYSSLANLGEPLTKAEFRKLIAEVNRVRGSAKVIVGGSGAWQIPAAKAQDQLRIDTVIVGEAEAEAAAIFKAAIKGEKLPKVVNARKPKIEEIPCIKKPALYGVVEITRGCGRGCQFCSPTMRTRYSFPLKKVLAEAKVNAKGGSRMLILQTEDIFLYKCKPGFIPNRDALRDLIKAVASVDEAEYMQVAHASLPPAAYDPKAVEEIAPHLVEKSRWKLNGRKVASVEVGVETGSVKLVKKYMKGKPLPYPPEEWPKVVIKAIEVYNDNDICPLATILVGLPGEKPKDVADTLRLIEDMKGMKIFYVPLLFTAEKDCMLSSKRSAELEDLTELHWALFSECWSHNIRMWTGAGAPVLKAGVLIAYILYYKWRYGTRILHPMAKMANLPKLTYSSYEKKIRRLISARTGIAAS